MPVKTWSQFFIHFTVITKSSGSDIPILQVVVVTSLRLEEERGGPIRVRGFFFSRDLIRGVLQVAVVEE